MYNFKLITLTLLFSVNAFAGKAECLLTARAFNKAHNPKMDVSIVLYKTHLEGMFLRSDPKAKYSLQEQAATDKVVKECSVNGGLGLTVWLGDAGAKNPKFRCEILNTNDLQKSCYSASGAKDFTMNRFENVP